MVAGNLQSDDQAKRLRQMVRPLLALFCVLAPIELVMALVLNLPVLLYVGLITALAAALMLLALALVRRAQVKIAAYLVSITALASSFTIVLLIPSASIGIVIAPLLALALLLPYLETRAIAIAGVLCVLAALALFWIGAQTPRLIEPPPAAVASALGALGVVVLTAITALLLWQFSARLNATIAQTQSANATLEEARAELERRVEDRTAELSRALSEMQDRAEVQARLLEENEGQRAQIREMNVPVLPISTNAIAIPLVGALDAERLEMLQEQALNAISASSARYLLLDVTGVPVVDTQVAQGIVSVVTAARLLGSEVVLVGVRPEVAQAVVSLGLDLHDITTRRSLYEGIAYAGRRI